MKLLKLFIVVSVLHLLIVVVRGNAVFAIENTESVVSKGNISLIIPTESAAVIAPVEESLVPVVDNFTAKKLYQNKNTSYTIDSEEFHLLIINLDAVQHTSTAIYRKICCYRQ